MTQKITIPQQNQPFRRQSSLGGNVSFRNLGGTDDNNYVVMAIVTKVYYKQGRVDFKLTNSTNHVVTETGDGTGSAPIPVDFYGYQRDGKIFGHYRPIQIGDLIAVAYLWGHKQAPIVLGVYPKDSSSYEFVAPQEASSFGDDKDEATYDYALGDRKIFPDGSLEYHSGNGKYFKTLRGKSFMLLDDSPLYEHLWVGYNDIGAFKDSDQNTINPLQEEAGDWLLVHEDNNEGSNSTDHRTRFYVSKDGTFQVVLSKSSSLDNLVILEGSKSEGFTLQELYDVPQKGWISEKDPHKEPDIKNAQQYVKFNIGGPDHSATVEAATKDDSVEQATKLEIKDDGIYVNGKVLVSSNPEYTGKTIVDDAINNSGDLNAAIEKASAVASAAAESAKEAGEIAKQAGISAEVAGNDAKTTGEDIKQNVIYYANKYKDLHPGLHLDGGMVAITGKSYIEDSVIGSAAIENGAIDHAKIADEAVGSSQIEDLAVTRANIAYSAIGTAQIENEAVTDAKIGSLSADKITTGTLDAGKINVVNLNAKSITAGTITADKLKIGQLSDIAGDAGQITDGKIVVKGNGKNSGVSLEGLDADNPDVYTPSKKAALANIVHAIESSAEASLDYAKQVGLSNDPAAIDLQNKYDAMVDGLDPIFKDMGVSTNFYHNTVEQLTSDCNNAIDKFQNLANSQLNRKIGQTADNKNSVYQGYEQPANPHINDIWFQENSDGTYQIRVYDGGSWISPGMKDIKEVQESVSTLPRAYYSSTQPTGTDYKDGDIWYKTSTDTTNNTVVYTAYKWNHNTNTWDPLLDATSSHNYVGSEPASPIEGDFWMDNTTLKQYQNGRWVVVPTQGPQGIPGVSAKQQYIHIAYATSANGTENFNNSTFSRATYIGLLVDFNEEDSSDPTKYTWSRLRGADGTNGKDGVPGKPGVDGKTSYVHFAYANSSDGTANFNLEYFDNALYIGTYTDFNEEDSKDHTKYTWSRLKGDPGADGKDGVAGKDGVGLKGTEVTYGLSDSDSTQPSNWSSQVPDLVKGQYLWSKTVWTYTDDTSETGYQKTYIAKDGNNGNDGIAGKDGVGIRSTTITYAVGTSGTTAPTSGWNSQVPNVPAGQYLWTKTVWSYTDNTNETGYSVAKMGDTGPKGDPGQDGAPGPKGEDGISTYVWIMYSNSESGDPMFRSPVGATYIGIATGKTSSTESSVPTDYKWTKIKGEQGVAGTPGTDGKTPYVHIAYANSADGNTDFTTDGTKASQATINNDPYQYKGTYVDYDQYSSQDHTMYTWTMIYDKSKKRNFTEQPTTPYNVGDTWTQSGATYFCKSDKLTGAFDASDWAIQQLTIQALDPSVANGLNNDNLVTGTDQEYVMGGYIPNSTWEDGYAYEKLPIAITDGNETLPQDPHTFFYTLDKGTTYTQTVWIETDTTVKDLSGAKITWFTTAGHDYQPATLIKLGENKYKLVSTYTWPGKSDNNVRLFDIVYLDSAFDLSTGTYLKFGKLKLEEGSVATPWCLSQSELTTTTRDYKGVTLNDRGLTATAGSTTVAMNSNDGFLINNASGQVFHVDTNGNLTISGNLTAGNSPTATISGVNFTGDNLTLNNSLKVINGNISADNGNVVINSNGLTIKDGGLNIVNGQGETTTMIKDNGTFSTIQGDFAGSVNATSLTLKGKDAYMDVGAGSFHVYSNGNVTANSISITGNNLGSGHNQASLSGVNIYNGSIIEGNTIIGNTIIGGKIIGSDMIGGRFSSQSNGANGISAVEYNHEYINDDPNVSPNFYVTNSGALQLTKVIKTEKRSIPGSFYNPYQITGETNISITKGEQDYKYYRIGIYTAQDTNLNDGLDIIYNLANNTLNSSTLSNNYLRGMNRYCFTLSEIPTGKDNIGITDSSSNPKIISLASDSFNSGLLNIVYNGTTKSVNTNQEWYHLFGDLGDRQYVSIPMSFTAEKHYELGVIVDANQEESNISLLLESVGTKHSTGPYSSFSNVNIAPSGSLILSHGLYSDGYTEASGEANEAILNSELYRTVLNSNSVHLSSITRGSNRADNASYYNYVDISSRGIYIAPVQHPDTQESPARLTFAGDNSDNTGIFFDGYGSLHGMDNSACWKIQDDKNNSVAVFPLNGQDNLIQFYTGLKVFPSGADHGIRTAWVSWSAWDGGERYPAIVQDGPNWGGICFPKSGHVTLFDHNGHYYTPDRDTEHGSYNGYGG